MSGPTEPCGACKGMGTLPHQKRRMGNGEIDPTDFQLVEICERCGGGGQVPVNKPAITEKKPGYIADQLT